MNLERLKEELRNKRQELSVGLAGSCFALGASSAPQFAALGMVAAAYSCLTMGIKDGSSGNKTVGWIYGIWAGCLFLIGAGIASSQGPCPTKPETAEERTACAESRQSARAEMLKLGGACLLTVLLNPLTGWATREKLRAPGNFSSQFVPDIRGQAPNRWYEKETEFESFVLQELARAGVGERQRYEWVCETQGITPEPYGNESYDKEAESVLAGGEWHCVYELIERCWTHLGLLHKDHFAQRVNDYLLQARIGWRFEKGAWERIGDEIADDAVSAAVQASEAAGAEDVSKAIEKAWRMCNIAKGGYEEDAVTAAMRALEGTVQRRTRQPKTSLSRIKGLDTIVPEEKLRTAIRALYGYSSEQARHANQDATITRNEAHLIVVIAAALTTYLTEPSERATQSYGGPLQGEEAKVRKPETDGGNQA